MESVTIIFSMFMLVFVEILSYGVRYAGLTVFKSPVFLGPAGHGLFWPKARPVYGLYGPQNGPNLIQVPIATTF